MPHRSVQRPRKIFSMKTFIFTVILLSFFSILHAQDFDTYYCLNITKYINTNIDSLNSDSLLIFFKQFSIKENENNAEFAEWGNETLFEVLEKQPLIFFKVLFSMSEQEQKEVEKEINSPINDGINILKIYEKIENCEMKKDIKVRALDFLKPSYDSFKKMVEEWERKNNQKWPE